MAEKKYYWLKLPKEFFTQPKIKKLRRIAGGDTYTIIYLKMQLISLEFGGFIPYQGIEATLAEEIALRIDEDVENVDVTINYLYNQGLLVEVEENVYKLPETVELIGSESASAARVRKHRKNHPKPLQCNNNVTQKIEDKGLGEYGNVKLSSEDIEGLKAKNIDVDKWIKRLDEYIESTGKTYLNHALTIKQWAEKEAKEQAEKEGLPGWYKEKGESKKPSPEELAEIEAKQKRLAFQTQRKNRIQEAIQQNEEVQKIKKELKYNHELTNGERGTLEGKLQELIEKIKEETE